MGYEEYNILPRGMLFQEGIGWLCWTVYLNRKPDESEVITLKAIKLIQRLNILIGPNLFEYGLGNLPGIPGLRHVGNHDFHVISSLLTFLSTPKYVGNEVVISVRLPVLGGIDHTDCPYVLTI